MNFDQMLELIAVLIVVGLPVSAITFRLAARPIVDAIVRISEALGVTGGPRTAEERQIGELREEVGQLRRRVAQLEESESFYRSLQSDSEAAGWRPAEQPRLDSPHE